MKKKRTPRIEVIFNKTPRRKGIGEAGKQKHIMTKPEGAKGLWFEKRLIKAYPRHEISILDFAEI